MAKKIPLSKQLNQRKYKPAPRIISWIYKTIMVDIVGRKYKPNFHIIDNVNDCDGPCFVIFNHLSRIDHMYVVDSNLRSHAKDGEFYIRIYWNDDYVVAESSLDGKVWSMLYALQRSLMPGDFKTVKLGKMPKSYGWPRTVKEEVKGNDQEADYYDLTFYYKK